ncbi:WhiB family transcriptional regulator [Streptomyces sp. TLI_053]|uniref:WhiB family transcriptional regulator n=1 Tax=Streptomyces sp. TLI_053 TaxID=1855352 RepID=UPI001352092A|nr:WhiB family transcriptional regulator [Streptomyces sp. TLI_053]
MASGVAPNSEGKPCAGIPLHTFFPHHESRNVLRPGAEERRALAFCARCGPRVREVCLERQIAHGISEQNGVVGGTTAAQRRELIRLRVQGTRLPRELARAIERQIAAAPDFAVDRSERPADNATPS